MIAPVGLSATAGIVMALAVLSMSGRRPRPRRTAGPTGEAPNRPVLDGSVFEAAVRALTRVASTTRSTVGRRSRPVVGPATAAEWCDELGRAVRSGQTLREVLITTAPNDPALASAIEPVRRRLERGAPVSEAWPTHANEPRTRQALDEHVELVGEVVTACAIVGGSAAPALDRTAAALRQRAADAAERSAQSAQATASARVLTIVPLAALALLALTDGGVRAVMSTPAGLACIGAGLAVNAFGWWWMRRIIGGDR